MRITQQGCVKCQVKDVSLVDVDKIHENEEENDPNLPDEGDQGKFAEVSTVESAPPSAGRFSSNSSLD